MLKAPAYRMRTGISPERLKANILIVGLGGMSFAAVQALCKSIPDYSSVFYSIWAVAGMAGLKLAYSIETEPVEAALKKWAWKYRHPTSTIDLESMSPEQAHLARYAAAQASLGTLAAAGRGFNNNADMATALRWYPAHMALVAYLESPSETRKSSLVHILASALPSAWLNCSIDYSPNDQVLTGGARILLADFAAQHGINLIELIYASVLQKLSPTASQRPFCEAFLRHCLTPH